MPEYIVFSICLIILSVTGVLKSPCRAVGLSMFEMLYMLLCALALSVFDMTLSVELKVNAGAAVMIFLPALLVEETRENQGGAVAALVLFSSVIALVERSGLVYGSDNGLFSALMAGTSAVLLNESRGCACCSLRRTRCATTPTSRSSCSATSRCRATRSTTGSSPTASTAGATSIR